MILEIFRNVLAFNLVLSDCLQAYGIFPPVTVVGHRKSGLFGLQARLKSLQCAESAALRRGDTEAAKRVNQSMYCTFVVLVSMQVPTKHCVRFNFLCYHPLL